MRQTWTRVLVVASVAAVGVLTMPSSPASARDRLVQSSPKRNVTLDASPRQVAITFSGEPQADGSSISVIGPDGRDATDGATRFEGNSMSIGFDATTKGRYTVTWEAISSDGDPISGQYGFTLTSTRGPLGNSRPSDDDGAAGSGGTDDGQAGASGSQGAPQAAGPRPGGPTSYLRELPLTIWIVIASVVLVFGGLIVLSALGRRQMRTATAERPPDTPL